MKALLHDTDKVLYCAATQHARLAIMRRANELASMLVDQALADDEPERRIRVVVGIDHEDKTIKQRGFYHAAVLPQISEQAEVAGLRFTAQIWKTFFHKLYIGDRWESIRLPGQKRATPRRVRISSEDLSIKQYSELLDKVIAYAVTELGVNFHFIAEEREAVRWVAKPRKVRAKQSEGVEA